MCSDYRLDLVDRRFGYFKERFYADDTELHLKTN